MVAAAVARLSYATATSAVPRIVSEGPLRPERAEGWIDDPRDMPIHDGREATAESGLDLCGFELVEAVPATVEQPGERARRRYHAEAEAIVLGLTGAAWATAFDSTRRASEPPTRTNLAVGAPVLRVHNDFTRRSALETVDQVRRGNLRPSVTGRVAILSVWRPLRGPVFRHPLALADSRTVSDDDLVVVRRCRAGWEGETAFLSWRPTHRWVTFPALRSDEAIVFKLFDSAVGVAWSSPHTAFIDPGTPVRAPTRASIEVRVLACY
jgi:hypothetical protein